MPFVNLAVRQPIKNPAKQLSIDSNPNVLSVANIKSEMKVSAVKKIMLLWDPFGEIFYQNLENSEK